MSALQSLLHDTPVFQAFVATVGTYLLTVIGTIPVLFFRTAPRGLMDGMMGFAAGVMVAASCWSLLSGCRTFPKGWRLRCRSDEVA